MNYQEPGIWGMFRLFDTFELAQLDNTQSFIFKVTQDSKTQAEYQLLAKKVINPFIPGVLENFQLDKSISVTPSYESVTL